MATILHIDDEESFSQSTAVLLEDYGFNMISACNASDGISKILEEKPDLVLCDVNLQGVSGFDILKEIRDSGGETSSIPFILLSATDKKEDIVQGHLLNADDYLIKPVDSEILLCKIRNCLQSRWKLQNYIKEHITSNLKTHSS